MHAERSCDDICVIGKLFRLACSIPMSALCSVRELQHSFGVDLLFDGLSLTVADGERLAVIGPNGSGKSTLLRIIAGALTPEGGAVDLQRGMRVRMVQQQEDHSDARSIAELIAAALDPALLEHERDARVSRTLKEAGFEDGARSVATLSGGWRKRLALCAALAAEPDLLLLDEPTNHLDPHAVRWLEARLRRRSQACVIVSHDRWFLDQVVSDVLEINARFPGGSFRARGSYAHFLEQRADFVEELQQRQAALANQHRREQEWLKRSPKARTTKNVARIKQAQDLRDELKEVAQLNAAERSAGVAFTASGRRSKDLVVAEGLRLSRGGRLLFDGLDCRVGPGTRLGVLGGNGSGKSSLLACLAESLTPDAGRIKQATELRVATFDQTRSQLDRDQTLRHALAPNGTNVEFQGRQLRVNGWAQRFLFDESQLEQRVDSCSGGEQARLLIAQLMLRPADLLVLDEPTNDLDIPSLEVLERALLDFAGGVLLVSHDRWLLDRLCTDFIALDGAGGWQRVGSYRQWEERQRERDTTRRSGSDRGDDRSAAAPGLSFAEQKELRKIEGRIDKADGRLSELAEQLADPALYTRPDAAEACQALQAAHAEAQALVDQLYARWEELEAQRR